MLNIEPIKLLSGSHEDIGTTGQGCFMNVIAYLNGEAQITDRSPCVCVTIRPMAIWLNDMANQQQRQQLIPFIERAMGSATEDVTEMKRRINLVVEFADEMAQYAAKYAQYAAKYAAQSAQYAAKYAQYAAEYAQYAAQYAAEFSVLQEKLFQRGIKLMDNICPIAQKLDTCVIQRAEELVALCKV